MSRVHWNFSHTFAALWILYRISFTPFLLLSFLFSNTKNSNFMQSRELSFIFNISFFLFGCLLCVFVHFICFTLCDTHNVSLHLFGFLNEHKCQQYENWWEQAKVSEGGEEARERTYVERKTSWKACTMVQQKKINRNSVYCSRVCCIRKKHTRHIRSLLTATTTKIIMTVRCAVVLHCTAATNALLHTLYLFFDKRVT